VSGDVATARQALKPREAELQRRLGYQFRDPELLLGALRHRSWVAEQSGQSNERLEFLGDAVLGMIVTDYIFELYPSLPEGELAKVRAAVVNAHALAEVAGRLSLGEVMYLGKGEAASGGREKPSILADAMEAVLGALYLDGGWKPATGIVLELFKDRIAEAAQGPGGQDFKTRLQELTARRLETAPHYEVSATGPDHAKRFHAAVLVRGMLLGEGEGRSKKQAEQAAAREAWTVLAAEQVESDLQGPTARDLNHVDSARVLDA
jgi:ribonuclease III